MHFNLEQILWAVALAAHLVLLIVLFGRDRASRFPFFTAAIILGALRLLADHLLESKLTTLAFYWQDFSGIVLDSLLRILVLLEVARHIFASGRGGLILKPRGWAGWSILLAALALIGIYFWGPWPAWQALRAEPERFSLLLLVLIATKGQLLTAILTIETVVLILIFAKRFGFPWRTHPRQIAIGLLFLAISVLSAQGITEYLKQAFNLRDRVQYDRATQILTQTDNVRQGIGILVLLWWIVWLWRDEPAPLSSNNDESEELTPTLAGPSNNSLSAQATSDEATSNEE